MANDLISRSALSEVISTLTMTITGLRAGKNVLNAFMTEYRKSVLRIIDDAPAVDAVPVEKLGKFGRLFLPYKGCPRGRVGRMGDGHLEEEALFWGTIEDVDGGRWVPVVEAVLLELIEKAKSAVDAVEVVRCRDCKYYDSHGYKICALHSDPPDEYGCGANMYVEKDDFCSYGERRADDGK